MSEFWRDSAMDQVIGTIVEIFSMEGVELVRTKGLTKYLNKIKPISTEEIEMIISKLNIANVIDYEYELHCPHCNERSYIIVPKEENGIKMCDTCQTFYPLEKGKTLFINITRK